MTGHTLMAIPAFNDNYIWLITHPESNQAAVVDPGDATPVLATLDTLKLELSSILITHHHYDHTGGIEALLEHYPATVYGPAASTNIDSISARVKQRDTVTLKALDLTFSVIETPGHTLDHIAYTTSNWAFVGDTLFAGGCGRLFEGTAEQLYSSLRTLAALPKETHIYCAHEYTLANLAFAKAVEPSNQYLLEHFEKTKETRIKNLPTLPTSVAQETLTNPFLRCHLETIKASVEQHAGRALKTELDVFAELRQWKDTF
jgi:hydroxyacylglutathione hydrolase